MMRLGWMKTANNGRLSRRATLIIVVGQHSRFACRQSCPESLTPHSHSVSPSPSSSSSSSSTTQRHSYKDTRARHMRRQRRSISQGLGGCHSSITRVSGRQQGRERGGNRAAAPGVVHGHQRSCQPLHVLGETACLILQVVGLGAEMMVMMLCAASDRVNGFPAA